MSGDDLSDNFGFSVLPGFVTLVTLTVIILLIISLTALVSSCYNAYNAIADRTEVQGTINVITSSKLIINDGVSQEFAISLTTIEGERIIVNCTSTECASLRIGDEVLLSCYTELNIEHGVSSKIKCRFDSLI